MLIIGGGIAGTNAAMIALGMGAQVTLLDRSLDVLRRLATQFDGRVRTIFSTRAAIADLITKADLVIGAVLVPGSSAPKLITKNCGHYLSFRLKCLVRDWPDARRQQPAG